MHTLYWIPGPSDPTPRFMSFDDKGLKSQITPKKVKTHEGALEFVFPENLKNTRRYENAREPWHKSLPKKGGKKKSSEQKLTRMESAEADSILKDPLNREELIEMLDNNGIAFKKNQKTLTLFEKLPDDIARNFKLVESELEVQAI